MSIIYEEYFRLTKEYQVTYGTPTILLMQVGAFFEIYGLKNPDTGEILNSEIEPCSLICNLNMCEKKLSYNGHQIIMSGFRDHQLEKYLQKITENNYTAVVYVQEKNEKNTKRIFHSVHSAGTYISFETDTSPQITNNIMCVWFGIESAKSVLLRKGEQRNIHGEKNNLLCGVSVVNIFTGKSFMFEYQTPYYSKNPTTYDELERNISVYSPSEIIIISPFDKNTLESIVQYCGIKTTNIHYVSLNVENMNNDNSKKAIRCTEQKYINHILSKYHGEEAFNICSEFQMFIYATQSYCYLLDFIQVHNSKLVRGIEIPIFNNVAERLILANHTLKQLNIIDDNSIEGNKNIRQLSSVLSFLNKCCCAMGKRKFQHHLLNPTFNIEWLNREYEMIEYLIMSQDKNIIQSIRKLLVQVYDIEKICRQITIQKIYPSSVFSLYKSVNSIQEIFNLLSNDNNRSQEEINKINNYLCSSINLNKSFMLNCSQFNDFLINHFNIENCKGINNIGQCCEQNIIKPGVSPALDKLFVQYKQNIKLFETIQEQLNVMANSSSGGNEVDHIKIHETDKLGLSLQITKKRAILFKSILQQSKCLTEIKITNCNCGEEPHLHDHILNDIKFVHATTTSDEIESPLLKKIVKNILNLKEKINKETNNIFLSIIQMVENDWIPILKIIADYASNIDVLQCKSYIAIEYKYVRPVIKEDSESESFVEAYNLRHCLIEQLQKNELYVPNDIYINDEVKGILLYGTNAVGKTSIIRALGISIIMAQSGMYVPASKFIYKPYTAIFSRILGNDNIFKGLSTFAVEMSELRTILKMADNNSLILGDELCSGTETESALSIFVAGLMELHNKKSSFIFATHFHEITGYDEIANIPTLKCMHLSVSFDREMDCLVYDRKLKDGSGTRMYGLEVCKSLYLPETFLETAHKIRNKYYSNTRGELSNNSTKYNSKKIRGMCEICNTELGEEIHHLREQSESDNNGFIDTFHKNHSANLISICQKCHDEIHLKNNGGQNKKSRKVKTTKGYKII